MRASRNSFASASCSALLAIGLAGACSKPTGAPPPPPTWTAAPSAPPTPPVPDETSDPYLTARPVRSKSVGHTSYVLKLTLEGGIVAAFKPRSRLPLGDRRYKGEIAAYRLAIALGLDNVPRAMPRSFAADELRAVQADLEEKALIDDDGRVRGA